jgi:hypothetical protein
MDLDDITHAHAFLALFAPEKGWDRLDRTWGDGDGPGTGQTEICFLHSCRHPEIEVRTGLGWEAPTPGYHPSSDPVPLAKAPRMVATLDERDEDDRRCVRSAWLHTEGTLEDVRTDLRRCWAYCRSGSWPAAPAAAPAPAGTAPDTPSSPEPIAEEYPTKKAREAAVRAALASDAEVALALLLHLYQVGQTPDEQECGHTEHLNGCGFGGRDSEILSKLACQVLAWHQEASHKYASPLSPRQMDLVHRLLPKYHRQAVAWLQGKGLARLQGKGVAA